MASTKTPIERYQLSVKGKHAGWATHFSIGQPAGLFWVLWNPEPKIAHLDDLAQVYDAGDWHESFYEQEGSTDDPGETRRVSHLVTPSHVPCSERPWTEKQKPCNLNIIGIGDQSKGESDESP